MPVTMYHLLSRPFSTLRVLVEISTRVLFSLTRRILLAPFKSSSKYPTTLRTEVVAAILGPCFAYHHLLIYEKSSYIDEKRYSILKSDEQSRIDGHEFLAYVLPAELNVEGKSSVFGSNQESTDFVMLFAHGGGYAVGDALMYIKTFERWIKEAAKKGYKLRIVSVEYPLSPVAPYPACLNSFNAVYNHLLKLGFRSSQIVFAGDSAGGGLVTMSSLSLSQLPLPLPQPAGTILISPWLDLAITSPLVSNSPNAKTDWLIVFDTDAPKLAKLLADELPVNDPRISPGLTPSNSPLLLLLPPQLITAGTAEILLPDSTSWASLCKGAGVAVEEYYAIGEIHTFSMGYPLVSSRGEVERHSDRLIIDFIERVCN